MLKGNSNEKMEHFETACEDIRDIGPKYKIVGHHYHHQNHESIPENFNQYCVKVIGRTGWYSFKFKTKVSFEFLVN